MTRWLNAHHFWKQQTEVFHAMDINEQIENAVDVKEPRSDHAHNFAIVITKQIEFWTANFIWILKTIPQTYDINPTATWQSISGKR